MHADTSDIVTFLAQCALDQPETDENLEIIAFISKDLAASQRRHSATTKKCYVVVTTLHNWREYLWSRHFTVCTDHTALRYPNSMQDTSNMLSRWAVGLQAYDLSVQHMPGKLNVIPDILS